MQDIAFKTIIRKNTEIIIGVNDDILSSLITETLQLAKKQSAGKPPSIRLSPETAALLESISKPALHTHSPFSSTGEIPTMEKSEEQQNILPAWDHEDEPANLSSAEILSRVAREAAGCLKCPLGKLRTHSVPGEGNPNADLVFVGEAPGEDEDLQGRPFVGRSGQLLTDIIVKGMHLRREEVFICNVLKCRPPGNRTPNPEEVMQCEPYLLRQLYAMHPKVICALGLVAAQTLLKTKSFLRQLRGRWHNYHDIPLRVTYHPAYLLRNPGDKTKAWEDIKEVMRVLSGDVHPEI